METYTKPYKKSQVQKISDTCNNFMKDIQTYQMNPEENLEGIVGEMGKSIIGNSESIEKIKLETAEKFARLEKMILSLQSELKLLKKNGGEAIEYSQILQVDEIEQIKKWVDPTNYNKVYFKLLYRATEHGKAAKDFHSRCDNKVI